jgi:hypothetical protein
MKDEFRKFPDFQKKYLNDFKKFKYDFIDDLPPERLLPGDENYNLHKCRGNYFVSVAGLIDIAIRKGAIKNPDAVKIGNEYRQYVRERDFSLFSTKEDIEKVNSVLDMMIKELSK